MSHHLTTLNHWQIVFCTHSFEPPLPMGGSSGAGKEAAAPRVLASPQQPLQLSSMPSSALDVCLMSAPHFLPFTPPFAPPPSRKMLTLSYRIYG